MDDEKRTTIIIPDNERKGGSASGNAAQNPGGPEQNQSDNTQLGAPDTITAGASRPKIELIGKREHHIGGEIRKSSRKNVVILVIAVVLIITGYFAVRWIMAGVEGQLFELTLVKVTDVDMKKVPDGIYYGGYKAFPIEVEVSVKVADNKITGITLLKHVNGQGGAAEIITDKIVKANSLQVDIISGATYSSKVILKAVEAALESSLE